MAAKRNAEPRGAWTVEEIARDARVKRWRAAQERNKTPQDRLEETVRLSRLMSELRSVLVRDVRT